MPKVSVIMGIYNTNNREIVEEAIESILNQTFKNFEFIICDDGSKDGTLELIEKLTKKDGRVKIIKNNKNEGLAASLNSCIEISRGKYIARMDADDVSSLDRLEKQVNFLDSNKSYSIIGSDVILFNGNRDWGYRNMPTQPEKKDFLFRVPFMHPTILVRKKVLIELGGYRVEKETRRCEDYDLFMRMYAAGHKGFNINEALFRVRETPTAYKRRKYRYRIDEAKVRFAGYRMLGLMPVGFIYAVKPLLVGLIPHRVLELLKNERIKA
jgi:glycosyltransferase EpsE